ncbi:MAG TPA: signal peptidase II [Nitrospiraceae bacterium]|nr:signal peptidase II [Nitrospiraceae bacterium]
MGGPARYATLAAISIATVIVDQASKTNIMQTMRLHESIPIIPDFLSLTYIRNPGAAFGLLASSSHGFRLVFFGITSLFALGLLAMIFLRLHRDDWIGQLSIAGILGGAIGNLLDRVRFGEVIDFLDFYVNGYHWPAFNVADAAISVGVFFLILHFALDKKEEAGVLQQDRS